MSQPTLPVRTFEPNGEYSVIERGRLPHWIQAGTICFVTWRTWDSLPKAVLSAWLQERAELLRLHGIDAAEDDWRNAANQLPAGVRSRHFDEQRYLMLDYVVMPNHVHFLASFPSEGAMLDQCKSWKHYTAVKLNRALGRKGRFWEEDQFDHLVRCADEFERYRNYIADNPRRAKLGVGRFLHFSKAL